MSRTVSGTPSATPDAEPKLEVMSLRTTPDSVSTLGPLEPSPGYGPAVSSGISPSATSTSDSAGIRRLLQVRPEAPRDGPTP